MYYPYFDQYYLYSYWMQIYVCISVPAIHKLSASFVLLSLDDFNYDSFPSLANCLFYVVFFSPFCLLACITSYWFLLVCTLLHPPTGWSWPSLFSSRGVGVLDNTVTLGWWCILGRPHFGQGVPSRLPYVCVPAMERRHSHCALAAPWCVMQPRPPGMDGRPAPRAVLPGD